jgi:VWFA-related protein
MNPTRCIVPLIVMLSPATGQILLNPPRDASVISVDVNLVNVLCTVRDKNGAFVKDLKKEDFEIREDGRPQEIRLFSRDVDSPMTVALMIDVSGSVANIIGIEKAAGSRFLSEVLRPTDKALLAGFAQLIAVWQDLTSSIERLDAALDQAGPFRASMDPNREVRPRGGTLLYDAVNLVATQKLKQQPGRKTIVLITDGLDNGSIASLEQACRVAQEADAVVYAIHYEDEERVSRNQRDGVSILKHLSEPTGGRTFQVTRKMPLETIFETIRDEMRSQYGIGYKPPNPETDGTHHRLEVKALRPGLKVQARTGYYAIRK